MLKWLMSMVNPYAAAGMGRACCSVAAALPGPRDCYLTAVLPLQGEREQVQKWWHCLRDTRTWVICFLALGERTVKWVRLQLALQSVRRLGVWAVLNVT